MPQIDDIQVRLDQLIEQLLNTLPPSEYTFTKPDFNAEPNVYFVICKKGHGGQHWGRLQPVDLQKARFITAMNPDNREAYQKLRAYAMDGVDPAPREVRKDVPMMPVDQVGEIVKAAVRDALAAQKLSFLQGTAAAEANTPVTNPAPVKAAAPEAVPKDARSAERSIKPAKPRKTKKLSAWAERCKEMGLEAPKPSPSNPLEVDGRSLRRLQREWDIWQASKQPASV